MKFEPFRIVAMGICLLFLSSCSILKFKYQDEFVKVEGKHFIVGDNYYFFGGTNFWYGAYLGMDKPSGNRERLVEELDNLQTIGITNLRVLGGSELSPLEHSLKPAMQTEPGTYYENLLDGLDYLLYQMSLRKMRAVIFFNNYWEWSGGMGQYIAWVDSVTTLDPQKAEWPEYNKFVNSYYRNEKANKLFKNFIYTLITRKNKYSGYYYYEDPTIMAWELANEPRPGEGEDGEKYFDYFLKWVKETSEYIKSIDPNHLVTTGSEGTIGCLRSVDKFLAVHQIKTIDYATFHIWAPNWGWYDAKYHKATYQRAIDSVSWYIDRHIKLGDSLNKPMVLEEFGLNRDEASFDPASTVNYRDRYYSFMLDKVWQNARNNGPLVGFNFWAWGGNGRAANQNYWWKPGDPFTGDPPQEPQGLFSVFDSDTSTIRIIRDYANKLNSLNHRRLLNKLEG